MMDDVITDEEEEVEVEKDDKNDNSKEKIMKKKKGHPDHPAARPDTSNPGKLNSGGGGVVVADAVIETGIETGIETATDDYIIDTAVDNAATTSDSDSDSYVSLSDCDGCCCPTRAVGLLLVLVLVL